MPKVATSEDAGSSYLELLLDGAKFYLSIPPCNFFPYNPYSLMQNQKEETA
jgi:hypothetical protein